MKASELKDISVVKRTGIRKPPTKITEFVFGDKLMDSDGTKDRGLYVGHSTGQLDGSMPNHFF